MSAERAAIAAAAFLILGMAWLAVNIKIRHNGPAKVISYVNMWSSLLVASVLVVVAAWSWLA